MNSSKVISSFSEWLVCGFMKDSGMVSSISVSVISGRVMCYSSLLCV